MMRRNLQTVCVATLLLFAAACSSDRPSNPVVFFPLAYSDFTAAHPLAVPGPATVVFREQTEWEAFWQNHAAGAGPAPSVDFSQDMLIAVFWGARTGCFSSSFVDAIERFQVRIDGINTTGVIEVEVGALPDLGTCATTVYPLQVVRTDASIAPVEFLGMVPS